jgi:bifunctional UDP-N-acetylglucosamine pyrophosphorylase/glucosamine-1-phosphate N-acetyltransferase
MNDTPLAIIVLAAGLGTRMKSRQPKVMHPLAGRPMIRHLLATLAELQPTRIVVVIGPEMAEVAAAVAPWPVAIQEDRLGTGHAVGTAAAALSGFVGDVLIVYGDTPLISAATLRRMIAARHAPPRPAVVVLGFEPADPGGYGRLVTDGDGALQAIVEAKDASPAELALRLCNSGVMAVDGAQLFPLLARVGNANAKGEYYLTDIVGLARADGLACGFVKGAEAELIGINSRADLARAEGFVQAALRARAMAEGATLIDPASVFFSWDTRLGQDVVVGPHVVFGTGVEVGDGVEIRAFCHLEGSKIAAGAQIGPFARLRPGAVIGPAAHVGNFVEIKNAVIDEGAKVNHLTYLGDAHIGARANIGAGTITCNYDGFFKSMTEIGAGAFIGSNAALVAPVKIGAGAIIGAGSAIARDVPADALALTRAPLTVKEGWAAAFRRARQAAKAAKASVAAEAPAADRAAGLTASAGE